MKLGVLISGRGSNLEALLDARAAGRLPMAQFGVVISNCAEARGLEVARRHGVETIVIEHRRFPGGRAAHDRAVRDALLLRGCGAVVLAGYMRVIGRELLDAFPRRIINIHPSLLPAFPGLDAQRQALDAGVKVCGCTVHFVDDGMDSGPIILQETVNVQEDDSVESLSARILAREHEAIVEAVDALSRGELRVDGRRVTRTKPIEILLATGNAHKVKEIQAILNGVPVRWRTTREWQELPEPEENGATYIENARIKAIEWARRTGLRTLADDSGLEVEALGGRPGLHSARYAKKGEDRCEKLLAEMAAVPEGRRAARFVCCTVLAGPQGVIAETTGTLKGRIAFDQRGAGGFGFDPVFVPDGFGERHLAEYTESEKNAMSHRGRALAAMRGEIQDLAKQS